MEFIYILREREFVKTNENIYKIGRTSDWLKRFNQYPKNSELIFVRLVEDSKNSEVDIVNILKRKTKQRTDIGREYFEGEINIIVREVFNICEKYLIQENHYVAEIDDTPDDIVKIVDLKIIEIENEKKDELSSSDGSNNPSNEELFEHTETTIEQPSTDEIKHNKKITKEDKIRMKNENLQKEKDEFNEYLKSFLTNELFIVKGSNQKILRSKLNLLFNEYSNSKFNKTFKSTTINDAMRRNGIKEYKINGEFYWSKIDIKLEDFKKYIQ